MLKKQNILKIKNVYTAHAFQSGSQFFIGAGSETEPVVQLYNLATEKMEQPDHCPGGMMSFIPIPGNPDAYVSIMGLFPPFIGKDAALYIHIRHGNSWETSKAMDLPFAHRCEFLHLEGGSVLVAASVSQHKENPQDWSKPGEIYLLTPGESLTESWGSQLLDSGITRNHGMTKTSFNGREALCVSGVEGIFALSSAVSGGIEIKQVFDREVSEMGFADLDGDGVLELITIEPFHGSALNIYKRFDGHWKLKFSDSLSFGHGLSSGMFNGEPVIVAGNRRDSLALEIFTVDNLDKGAVNRNVIEEEAGPTQTQVFAFENRDYILSANQRKNEVALYSGSLKA